MISKRTPDTQAGRELGQSAAMAHAFAAGHWFVMADADPDEAAIQVLPYEFDPTSGELIAVDASALVEHERPIMSFKMAIAEDRLQVVTVDAAGRIVAKRDIDPLCPASPPSRAHFEIAKKLKDRLQSKDVRARVEALQVQLGLK